MLKKVRVAAFDFEIIPWTHKEATSMQRYGECSSFELKIRIDETLVPVQMVDTLLHEIGHAIYWAYNIEDEDKEERIVSTQATAWTQIFRDNPELLSFITQSLHGGHDA